MLPLNFYQRGYTQYPPPVPPKEHTDLPFDVKALTRILKEFADPRVARQLLPTMSAAHIYMLEHRKEQKCSI